MNLLICGLPSSGKTTLAQTLSREWGWDWIDTDQLLQKERGCSCRDLFLQLGERGFRECEAEIMRNLQTSSHTIISLGGGALSTPETCRRVKEMGTLLYLSVEPIILLHRLLQKSPLPAFLDPQFPLSSFTQLVRLRRPIFERMADLTEKGPDFSANRLKETLGSRQLLFSW